MTHQNTKTVQALQWTGASLKVLDQRQLPETLDYDDYQDAAGVTEAIATMRVRGAPAIGVAAVFGVALAAREKKFKSIGEAQFYIAQASQTLAATRPTAVNLFWALSRMDQVLAPLTDLAVLAPVALAEAQRIYDEDIAINKRMGCE